jgi:hypothetical protein
MRDLGAPGSPAEHRLRPLEVLDADERLVGDALRPDPLVGRVPAQFGGVPERDVIDVDQDLVLALFVPHLPPGVARIDQDDTDGGLGPCDPAPMFVAGAVMG